MNDSRADRTNDASPSSLDAARAAKQPAFEVFRGLVPVTGIGITRIGGGYGLKVNIAETPPLSIQLPATVAGVPVRIEVTGVPKARTG